MLQCCFCCDKNDGDLKNECKAEFKKIEDYITCNKLAQNYLKMICFLMSNENKSQVAENFSIYACNGIITQQNVEKYFVYNDKQLIWKNHTEHVILKLSIAKDINSKLRHYAPTTTLKSLYFCFECSHSY